MKIYKVLLKETKTLFLMIASWALAPIFMLIHIIIHEPTPKGQYYVYRPLYIYIDGKKEPEWVFGKYVKRDECITGSGPETMECWFEYKSIK